MGIPIDSREQRPTSMTTPAPAYFQGIGTSSWMDDAFNYIVDYSKQSNYPSVQEVINASPMISDVFRDKYCTGKVDKHWIDVVNRVADGIYENDPLHKELAEKALALGLWSPGGRILAGAGTGNRVTLMNCFVNGTLEDSMIGIIKEGLTNTALTQQQGGGIGTDFSPIRPPLALVSRTNSPASGPGPFIDSYDAVATTVSSAGSRRAAEMGTISDTHPWMPQFVVAKHQKGRWTNFNVSVLISDAFMAAVEDDEEWILYHQAIPYNERPKELVERDFVEEDTGIKQYVYSVHKARALWDLILESTYEYAEPGVIFIDRVNNLNNLQYCETIRCTNPCGEQPLPPHGTCNLGSVNLSRMVRHPFTEDAEFDWTLLEYVVCIGARFLDNVIDVTGYPLPEQEAEEFAKRRIGLGIMGLADAMAQLGIRYGSGKSFSFTEEVMRRVCLNTYATGVALAQERGSFPLYDGQQFFRGFAGERLPTEVIHGIRLYGIRFGICNTIAPTGTTSLAMGNIGSALEPIFLHHTHRKVRQLGDGSSNTDVWKEYDEYSFSARLWMSLNPGKGIEDLPKHMVTTNDVKIHEHLRIQEVCQKWVDASISKTINLPTEITRSDFWEVYSQAYDLGCKGCTTYRPSDIRGSILSAVTGDASSGQGSTAGEVVGETISGPSGDSIRYGLAAEASGREGQTSVIPTAATRPEILIGRTIKLDWPGLESALYATLNYDEQGRPFELFLTSKDQRYMEWWTVFTMLASWLLRYGIPLDKIISELKQMQSLQGYLFDGAWRPSLVSYLGHKLEALHKTAQETKAVTQPLVAQITESNKKSQESFSGSGSTVYQPRCPKCGSPNLKNEAGCFSCLDCGDSKCG